MPFLQDDPVLLMDHSRTFGLQKLMIVDHIYVGLVAFTMTYSAEQNSLTLLQDELSCTVEIYV